MAKISASRKPLPQPRYQAGDRVFVIRSAKYPDHLGMHKDVIGAKGTIRCVKSCIDTYITYNIDFDDASLARSIFILNDYAVPQEMLRRLPHRQSSRRG